MEIFMAFAIRHFFKKCDRVFRSNLIVNTIYAISLVAVISSISGTTFIITRINLNPCMNK